MMGSDFSSILCDALKIYNPRWKEMAIRASSDAQKILGK